MLQQATQPFSSLTTQHCGKEKETSESFIEETAHQTMSHVPCVSDAVKGKTDMKDHEK